MGPPPRALRGHFQKFFCYVFPMVGGGKDCPCCFKRVLSFTALTPEFFCALYIGASGAERKCAAYMHVTAPLQHLPQRSLSPPLPFLDSGPGIAQRHRPVEHQGTGACVKINTEIALPLELVTTPRRRPGEAGLKLAAGQHF